MSKDLALAFDELNNAMKEENSVKLEWATELNKLLLEIMYDMEEYSKVLATLDMNTFCDGIFPVPSMKNEYFEVAIYGHNGDFYYFDLNIRHNDGLRRSIHVGDVGIRQLMRYNNNDFLYLAKIVKNWGPVKRNIEGDLMCMCDSKTREVKAFLDEKKVEEN